MRCRSVALVEAVKGPDGQCDLFTSLEVGVDDPDPRKPKVTAIELVPAGYLVTGSRGGRMLIPHANVKYCMLLPDEVGESGTMGAKVVSLPTRRGK